MGPVVTGPFFQPVIHDLAETALFEVTDVHVRLSARSEILIRPCRQFDGVRIATAEAGIKYKGRTDVLLMVFDRAGRGGRRIHPVQVPFGSRRFLPQQPWGGKARAVVVNSGNANAFTGKKGRECDRTDRAAAAAKAVGCKPAKFFSLRPALSANRSTRTSSQASLGRHDQARRARVLAGSRQGHHDDGHLSEGRDAQRSGSAA